ncbi:hypothetical protein J4434_04010 [Candidatus Woesearchaeota archaeon]|nr:hypothetical protein [Candidatus Woesearchaeota archaeon]
MKKERKKQLNFQFWKVENKEEALYVIKQCSYGFLFVAALNILLGFLISMATIIDGVIYLVFGLLLLFFKSRVISILLLLISGAGIVVTFLNKIGVTYGGSNVFLTIIVFYFAIASVYTTFKYHKIG